MINRVLDVNESSFQILYNDCIQPMWIYDVETLKFLSVNAAAINEYGYTHEEFANLTIKDIRPPEDMDALNAVLSTLTPYKTSKRQFRHLGKDKELKYVEILSHPITYTGRMCRLVTVYIITETIKHNQTQALLLGIGKSLSENLDLQTILQKVTDATTKLSSAQFGAFFYNVIKQSGEVITLYTLSGALQKSFEELGMPHITQVFHSALVKKKVVRVSDTTMDTWNSNYTFHDRMFKDHLPVVSYLAVPVISKSGTVIGGLFFGHSQPGVFTEEIENIIVSVASQASIAIDNATLFEELKVANQKNESLLEISKELNNKKDEFISVASHELRTPLTSIKASLQFLSTLINKGDDLGKVKHFLNKADSNINKLTRLIGDLLDVSRIEEGQLMLNRSDFNISKLIDEVTEQFNLSGTYEIIIQGRKDLVINADIQRIEQVLVNFLNNAIKYAPDSRRILINIEVATNMTKVSVQDFGIGISKEKLPYLFDRYYRVENMDNQFSGMGIGLYICDEIIKRHGGAIGVESFLQKGSTFWFSIPIIH
jgi:PAS domain S-box-containing protein